MGGMNELETSINPYFGANVRRVISADTTPAGIPPIGVA